MARAGGRRYIRINILRLIHVINIVAKVKVGQQFNLADLRRRVTDVHALLIVGRVPRLVNDDVVQGKRTVGEVVGVKVEAPFIRSGAGRAE